jgi:hypothetical protein
VVPRKVASFYSFERNHIFIFLRKKRHVLENFSISAFREMHPKHYVLPGRDWTIDGHWEVQSGSNQ